MRLLVTGGCGFIGSAFLRRALAAPEVERLVNVDSLTYSGRRENLPTGDDRLTLAQVDITDAEAIGALFEQERPTAIVNFAAESHVDRSLFAARRFVRTNIEGTLCLLEAARGLRDRTKEEIRFLQVSTDEVYGDLGEGGGTFREDTPLAPKNPYSATKAGADMLAQSFAHTHGLWCAITRSSNNYGPRQFPEKLIPLMISNAMDDEALPVYGDGKNIRDWLWVDDNCEGIWLALTKGRSGEAYNLGGGSERENVAVVRAILTALGKPESLIRYVDDRPGHDRRYAIDFSKAKRELGFSPVVGFEDGIERTVRWYQENEAWWRALKGASFKEYYAAHYGGLGLET